MSLMNRQLLLQAQSDLEDVLRRRSVGETGPQVEQHERSAKNRIAKFEKLIAADEAQAEAKRKAASVKKEDTRGPRENNSRQQRPPLPEDLDITCCDCTNNFIFTGKDQVFYTKNQWEAPVRCTDCREAKKNAKPSGRDVSCEDCKKDFFFSDAKSRVFEQRGWAEPKRCKDCADAHKSLVPITIRCSGGCNTDFTFSVKAQKDFKAKNWANPKVCRVCRDKKSTGGSVKSSKNV